MAVPATKPETPRWQLRIESALDFNQGLDGIGSAFAAPDTWRAWIQRPEAAADYAIRRVLTAFRLNEMLTFPVVIAAAPLNGGMARYTLAFDAAPAREILMAVAGDPAQDAALVSDLINARGAATDLAIFLDRDGVLGEPGDKLPVLSTTKATNVRSAFASDVGAHLVTPLYARLFAESNREVRVGLGASYTTDYAGWIEAQVALLDHVRLPGLDVRDLAEELGDLGRSTKNAIQSHLRILLIHLLKWRHQPDHRSGSWRGSIANARKQISKNLRENPSLKPRMPEWFGEEYADARELASYETELPLETFPEAPPFTLAQVLDETFMPDNQPPHAESKI